MAVGGILSQKTQRPIKVLYGGLETYWRESDFGMRSGKDLSTPSIQITPPTSIPAPSVPTQTQPETKKKSAGC
jgi:hypothetical protein